MAKRDTSRYIVEHRGKPIYVGITNDPERRAEEHRQEGMPGNLEVQGPKVTRETAEQWEREKIDNLRRRNGPKSLRNKN